MKTERLYYQDPGLEHFEARLVKQYKEKDRWIVILDRTAFYPEGGGQPADRGRLNGNPVLEVRLDGNTVLHSLAEALPEGETAVDGRIDSAWREDFKQQHTGQHIVSASLLKACGCQTLSVHLGETHITIEIDKESISERDIETVEELANKIITENRPVRTFWVEGKEQDRYPFRRPPPDRDWIRAVEIEGFDLAACGGVHAARTGEIGLIQTTGLDKIRGRQRLQFMVGRRAYRDYRFKTKIVSSLSTTLTCSIEDIVRTVQGWKETLSDRNRSIGLLQGRLAGLMAEDLYRQGEMLGSSDNLRLVSCRYRQESRTFLDSLYKKLADKERVIIFIGNSTDSGLQWILGRSADLSLRLKEIVPPLLPLIDGKGGGSDLRWQGMGRKADGWDEFLNTLKLELGKDK